MNNKTCKKCGISKPLDEFYNDKSRNDEKDSYCKKCRSEYAKNYHREHRKERNNKSRKYNREHPEETAEYKRKYRREHKEEIREKGIKDRQKNKEKIAKQKKEYYETIYREKLGCISMYENKNCASYLGVVIGERLCRYLFKDVEVMPYGNPGFDFICNRGKLIDVKSSCLHLNGKYPRWEFKTEKNKIADYFVCVAFDNIEDLNPIHMWMIPGNEVNHLSGIDMYLSKLYKWNQWERSVEEVQMCCTEMKNKGENKNGTASNSV